MCKLLDLYFFKEALSGRLPHSHLKYRYRQMTCRAAEHSVGHVCLDGLRRSTFGLGTTRDPPPSGAAPSSPRKRGVSIKNPYRQ